MNSLNLSRFYSVPAGFGRRLGRTAMVALVCAALTAACSSETGIVVEVTAGSDTAGLELKNLRFIVGVADGTIGIDQIERFVIDRDEGDRVDVSGRDLVADPYRLLLRPGDVTDKTAEIMVAVAALDADGTPVAFGVLDAPVTFIDGKVVQWEIVLEPDGRFDFDDACLRWTDDTGEQVLAPPDDRDCDGVTTEQGDCDDDNPDSFEGAPELCDGLDNNCNDVCDEELDRDGDNITECGSVAGECGIQFEPGDCDDDNPNIHPGAEEVCDGVDNNCDGRRFPSLLPCFAVLEGQCLVGVQTCADNAGAPTELSECVVTADGNTEPVGKEVCGAFDMCVNDGVDPRVCLGETAPVVIDGCRLTITEDGQLCPDAAIRLRPEQTLSACQWALLGGVNQRGYIAGLRAEDASPLAPTSIVCEPQFAIDGAPEAPVADTFALVLQDGLTLKQVVLIDVVPKKVPSIAECPEVALECEHFAAP